MFGVAALVFLYLASVGIYYFENLAQPEGFTERILMIGFGVVAVPTGLFTSALSKARL